MEVTFNFLEIRAMNTYPEHQVTPPLALSSCPAPSFRPLPSACVEMCCHPPAGCHRHGQDHLLAAAADAGAAGSHGQPHQLRPVSSLQQLHLRVSINAQPPSSPLPPPSPLLPPASSFSFGVVPSPRSRGKLANVNSSRQSVGNLAASLWGFFPLQQPNAFFSSFIFCINAVRIQLISACHSGLKQPTVTEIGSVS